MKRLRLETKTEDVINVNNIDLHKHVVLWKIDGKNRYILVKESDSFNFAKIENTRHAANGIHDTIESVITKTLGHINTLDNHSLEIYEL